MNLKSIEIVKRILNFCAGSTSCNLCGLGLYSDAPGTNCRDPTETIYSIEAFNKKGHFLVSLNENKGKIILAKSWQES
jgi:hypothetical protein